MTTSTERTSARTYSRSNLSSAIACGSFRSTNFFIRDRATWETFDANDISAYLFDGAAKAAAHIERIAYLDQPYTKQDEQNLVFMVEALLQARSLADEARA